MSKPTVFDLWMCRWLAKRAAASPPIFVGGATEWIDRPRTQEEENFRAFMGACGDGNDELAMDLANLPWTITGWSPSYEAEDVPLDKVSRMMKRWTATPVHRQLAFEVGTRLRDNGLLAQSLFGIVTRIRCIDAWITEGQTHSAIDSAPTRETMRGITVREADLYMIPKCRSETLWSERSNSVLRYDAKVDSLNYVYGGCDRLLDRSAETNRIKIWRDESPFLDYRQLVDRARNCAPWAPIEMYKFATPISASFWFAVGRARYRPVENALGDLFRATSWMASESLLWALNLERKKLSLPQI